MAAFERERGNTLAQPSEFLEGSTVARQDVIIRMRLAGEDFDREFKAKFDDIEQEAEKRSSASGASSGSGFAKGFLGAAGLGALGAAIGNAISSSADLGAEIASTSRQFNIGAENLQIWRQAAAAGVLVAAARHAIPPSPLPSVRRSALPRKLSATKSSCATRSRARSRRRTIARMSRASAPIRARLPLPAPRPSSTFCASIRLP